MGSNLTSGTRPQPYGQGGRKVNLPMSATAQVFEGALVSELSGAVVTATTPGAGDVIAVAEHDQLGGATDGATRVSVLYDQVFIFNAGDAAPTDATPFGTILYAETDNTVGTTASTFPKAGRFAGLEDDGRVRVFVNMAGQGAGASITAALSNTPAVALGVAASAGTDAAASRDDHVHPWAQKRTVALGHAMTGSADSNGTANTPINVGTALPARAIVVAVEIVVTTAAATSATAKLQVGWAGTQDALLHDLDLVAASPGSYDQDAGTSVAAKVLPVQAGGKQLTFTVTPDGGSKLSAMTALVGAINVYYVVAF